ncbi:Nitronate monooxygenase [bioreactor metagenome]|jgi:enoyl-[acyl-carrier protein] reductase II|uniref:Nitronate monooxygenase n=1 Tax=bioreactor metagenome TaxID=1076179 RepID=A0A644VM44_9ZZZZ|nr:enoyl-[acyl-carrier-protein] reductase FabK [Aminivibrio sp.]MEA4952988.1 enoyl-[acyl-carrier-protein] reductase FabK [Aminivibrio sp.]HPF85670.1 enoyl-[acyl-carrier-protein] reductase FabK [Aminivibrio sp.]
MKHDSGAAFSDNRITRLLGCDYPLVQGGMAWVADASLAAAVSNGGGLGIIAAANMPPDLLEIQLQKVRTLTDKPFGVNIMLMSPTVDQVIDLVAGYRVPIVTTGAGSPGKVIEILKPLGTIIVPVIASVAQAKRVEKQGADAVVAEGMEAGGHIGELTTMVLIPQIVDSVEIPVIAAGGIADGRGVAAAFALGAEGVQVGTRFICCEESTVHRAYKEAVLNARDRSNVVTGRFTGHPVRCLKNKLTSKFEELEKSGATVEEYERLGAGKLRAAVVDGDVEWGSVMAGQSAALVNDILPAAEIITELFSGAERVVDSLPGRNSR